MSFYCALILYIQGKKKIFLKKVDIKRCHKSTNFHHSEHAKREDLYGPL